MPGVGRFFLSLGSVLLSLVLGAAALALALFFFPDTTLQLHRWARSMGEMLLPASWPPHHERVLRAVADERLIVYMGFVMVARIVVALAALPVSRWIEARKRR